MKLIIRHLRVIHASNEWRVLGEIIEIRNVFKTEVSPTIII